MYALSEKNVNKGTFLWLIIGLFVANAFWGASAVAIKEAYVQLTTIEIVFLRFAIATPILIAATVLWKGTGSLKVNIKDIPQLVLISIIGISLGFFLQVLSLDFTTATNFTLIFNLSTFFILFFSAVMLGEKLTGNKILGAVVAFIGLAIIVLNGRFELSANLLGDGIALASAAAWGLYSVLGKRMNERYSTLTVLVYVFLFGSLELLPFYLMSPQTSPISFTGLTWVSLGFLTICCSIISFLVYNYGLEKLSASTVAVFIYVMPLSGVFLAILILGEPLTVFTILGAALIIFGMYQAERKEPDKYGVKKTELTIPQKP
ncbi:EamA/RhaT family transporter [Methanocella sp. CWC-04]|uniref:EamA/RhaT family transporter n=1 Tax=Methanooceanicella nereidis TaxID=2052831 RepID=A0AAP2W6X9_9EURY|nr:DMT family transporter [Methanocella sp. CWC-04]MCD1294704.1 EamA/RhaT family transporter [Methanocella sp. CWC-04]